MRARDGLDFCPTHEPHDHDPAPTPFRHLRTSQRSSWSGLNPPRVSTCFLPLMARAHAATCYPPLTHYASDLQIEAGKSLPEADQAEYETQCALMQKHRFLHFHTTFASISKRKRSGPLYRSAHIHFTLRVWDLKWLAIDLTSQEFTSAPLPDCHH